MTIGPSRTTIAPFRGVMVSSGAFRGLLSLSSATYEEWESVVGTNFALGGRTSVQLVGVRALPTSGAKPRGVRTQGFAAFFDPARGQSVAPDLIYTATHSIYGTTQIYLAATSDPRTPGRMVAVFN